MFISICSVINADLSDYSFRVNNGVDEYSTDGGTTWKKMGGSTLKCAKYGTITFTSEEMTVSISSLNLSSADEYMVILSSGGQTVNNGYTDYANAAYISSKTATSFKVKSQSTSSRQGIVSYQVITFV